MCKRNAISLITLNKKIQQSEKKNKKGKFAKIKSNCFEKKTTDKPIFLESQCKYK